MVESDTAVDREASLWERVTVEENPFDDGLCDVQGLDDVVSKLQTVFVEPMCAAESPVRAPGVVFYGPPGGGKSRVARAVAGDLIRSEFGCVQLDADDLLYSDPHHQGRVEDDLADLVSDLRSEQPVVVLLEDVESLQITSDGAFHTAIQRVREMNERVAVIGVLTQENPRVNPADTPGLFNFADLQLEITALSIERKAGLITRSLQRLTDETEVGVTSDVETALEETAVDADGTDVDDIARRAVLLAQTDQDSPGRVLTDHVQGAVQQLAAEQYESQDRFDRREDSDERFQPSVPNVSFDDIGGLTDAVRQLRERMTYPQAFADVYDQTPVDATTGVLLHGPPGTGKTLLAKAVATETDRSFFAVEGGAVKSKWFGESEERLRELFRAAREAAPSVVFFDEFDALAPPRSRTRHSAVQGLVNTLLAELDGIEGHDDVLVIAATNRREAIDSAMTRPGRLGDAIEISPPAEVGRREITRIHLGELPTAESVTPESIAYRLPDGTTGAEISGVVERALQLALRRSSESETEPALQWTDIERAIYTILDEPDEISLKGYN